MLLPLTEIEHPTGEPPPVVDRRLHGEDEEGAPRRVDRAADEEPDGDEEEERAVGGEGRQEGEDGVDGGAREHHPAAAEAVGEEPAERVEEHHLRRRVWVSGWLRKRSWFCFFVESEGCGCDKISHLEALIS